MIACDRGNYKIVDLLLDKGVNPNEAAKVYILDRNIYTFISICHSIRLYHLYYVISLWLFKEQWLVFVDARKSERLSKDSEDAIGSWCMSRSEK